MLDDFLGSEFFTAIINLMKIELTIPYEVLYVMWRMQQRNHEIYLVGGAVRDLLIQAIHSLQQDLEGKPSSLSFQFQEISDYDFATSATPSQVQEIFPESYYTNEFGTVGIAYDKLQAQLVAKDFILPQENIEQRLNQQQPISGNRVIDLAKATKIHHSLEEQAKQAQTSNLGISHLEPPPFEITTYRSEGLYSDFRHPEKVEWGTSIEQDLERRDFTINAMAIKILAKNLEKVFADRQLDNSLISINEQEYELVDQHHGIKDLAGQLICTVRSPNERFKEDALRMLRAVRLACQLGFKIEELTFAAIKTHAPLIQHISWERIQVEFLKIISSEQPAQGIRWLDETGLLSFLLPELQAGKGVEQGGHHDTDVWTHSLAALDSCPSSDPIVRLAVLLHDIGKPPTYKLRNGEITFYNHEIVSSRLADRIAKRLKLSNQQREKLFKLVRFHMFHYQPHDTDAAIRRMIKRVGLEYIDDILDLREGDRLGSGARRTSWRLEEMKQRIIDQLNQPFDVGDLAIDGHDLMEELKLKPGRKIGETLNHLLELVLNKPELNTKEKLLEEARQFLKSAE